MYRRFACAAVGAVAAGLLVACGQTIPGDARAGSSATPTTQRAPASDPCSLLTVEQATALGLEERGKAKKGDRSRFIPPSCQWEARADDSDRDLQILASTEVSLAEYTGGRPPAKKFEFGGLTWNRHPSIGGASVCNLGHEFADETFVMLSTVNYEDESKACELPKKAAPLVASHLPGGNRNPTLPSTSERPPSPLAGMEPCDLLTPKQLEDLGVRSNGTKTGKGRSPQDSSLPPGCQWEQLDPDDKVLLYVSLNLEDSAKESVYDAEPDGKFEAAQRSWTLYHGYSGEDWRCMLVLPVTKNSSVTLTGGDMGAPDRACVQLKKAAEMITPKIPKG